MSTKAILVVCAQALLIQSVFTQCTSSFNHGTGLSNYGWGAPTAAVAGNDLACGTKLGYGSGLGYGAGQSNDAGINYGSGQGLNNLAINVIPTSGGGLPVSFVSAVPPSGISLTSENIYEGCLSVTGELPFLSALDLEAVVPSAGTGIVNYSCGDGVTDIESIGSSAAYAPANAAISSAAYAPRISAAAPATAAIAPSPSYGGAAGQRCGCGFY